MNWRVAQFVVLFLGILFADSSRGAECWKLVYVASAGHAASGSNSIQAGQIVYDVQYSACTATEPNTPGQAVATPVDALWDAIGLSGCSALSTCLTWGPRREPTSGV